MAINEKGIFPMDESPNGLSNSKWLPLKTCIHVNNTECTWQVVLIYLFIYTQTVIIKKRSILGDGMHDFNPST